VHAQAGHSVRLAMRARPYEGFKPVHDCCIASGKLRHNCQLLEGRIALYGCRGRGSKRRKL